MDVLWQWLPYLFALLAAQFVLAPIVVRFKTTHPAFPEYEPVNIHQLPPDVADNFGRFTYTMSADGFRLVGYFRQLAYSRGVGFYLALLKNSVVGDMVYLIDIFADGLVPQRGGQIEFYTDFSDGTEINTNNGQQAFIHKENPEMRIFRFPESHNPRALYQIHRVLCARFASQSEAVVPADGLEVFHMSYGALKEIRKQAEFGYYYLDEKANVFRLTWKGAFIMTGKLAWPVGSLRKAAMKRKARATMRSMGY